MAKILDYSSPQTAQPNARRIGIFVTTIAVVAAILIIWRSAALAQSLIEWSSGCGTGRLMVFQQFMIIMPIACAVPASCWWYARSRSFGLLPCRLAFLASVVGWLVAFLFVL